jgi:signal transduction histidine kinase
VLAGRDSQQIIGNIEIITGQRSLVLHDFLVANRNQLIARCRVKASGRCARLASDVALAYVLPQLLDQIISVLRLERAAEPMRRGEVPGCADGPAVSLSKIGATARQHGHELLRRGYTMIFLVQDYCDLFQAVADLAIESDTQIGVDEFRTLNRCLDSAIAQSANEFAYQRDMARRTRVAEDFRERLGVLVHEARNLITTANYAMLARKSVASLLNGESDEILRRCLTGLEKLIGRSIEAVRTGAPRPTHKQLINMADFVVDVQLAARLEAQACGCIFKVDRVDPRLTVDADRDMLLSAVSNLLQNAFKFTAPGTAVSLTIGAVSDRVRIDVEDSCGGWAPATAERMFRAFNQCGDDKSGLGLGLSICRRCVEADDGLVSARNLPGTGCVFRIELPEHHLSTQAVTLI